MSEVIRARDWNDHPTAAVMQPYINLGGVPFIAQEEKSYLQRQGFESVLVAPRSQKSDKPWWRYNDSMSLGFAERSDHATWGSQTFWGNTNLIEMFWEERRKHEYLKNAQIVIAHEPALYRSVYKVCLDRGITQLYRPDPDKITAVSFHAMTTEENLENFKVIMRANDMFKMTDVAFVNSRRMQELYHGVFGYPYEIVPNPVDTKRFNPDGEKIESFGDINFADGKTNILYFGRLDARKGVDSAIEVINILAHDENLNHDFRFIIAGSGPDEEKLKQKVADYNLSDKVIFMGRITEGDKPKLYRTADFCYFPATYGESFGDVLLEAWACGKAVVAGTAFSPDLVKHGENGFLLETNEVSEAAKRVRYLLEEADVANNMGKNARSLVMKYDAEEVFGLKMDIIDKVRAKKADTASKCTSVYYFNSLAEIAKGIIPVTWGIMHLKQNILKPEAEKKKVIKN